MNNISLSIVIPVGSPAADILAHSLTSFAMPLHSRNGVLIISSTQTTNYDNY